MLASLSPCVPGSCGENASLAIWLPSVGKWNSFHFLEVDRASTRPIPRPLRELLLRGRVKRVMKPRPESTQPGLLRVDLDGRGT